MKTVSSADHHLRVHVVVHRSGRVRRRALAGERRTFEQKLQRRSLPGDVAVQAPLAEHFVDLGRVDDARQVDLAVRGHLRERSEDRGRGDHRRRHTNPSLRATDRVRDPVRHLLTALRREPRPHHCVTDLDRIRCHPSRRRDLALLPELREVVLVADRDSGRRTMTMTFSSRVHESSVQFVEPAQTASRSRTTYLWCIRSGQPGTGAVSNGSDSISDGSVFGGGGIGGRSSTSSRL